MYRKHIEALDGKIENGVSFVGLVQDAEGVTAELSQASDDGGSQTMKEKYDWVVGSDGAHSEWCFSSANLSSNCFNF